MHEIRKRFGNRIKYLRKLKGLTQEQLAEKANLSTIHVNAVEGGRKSTSFESILNIAEALGMHPKELFDFPWSKKPARSEKDPLGILVETLEREPTVDVLKVIDLVQTALSLRRRPPQSHRGS